MEYQNQSHDSFWKYVWERGLLTYVEHYPVDCLVIKPLYNYCDIILLFIDFLL